LKPDIFMTHLFVDSERLHNIEIAVKKTYQIKTSRILGYGLDIGGLLRAVC